MPKLKRASSSYSACQATKRKKIQREDNAKRQQEQERDSIRHQRNSISNPHGSALRNSEVRRNVIRKHNEVPVLIPREDEKKVTETKQPIEEFVLRILKEDEKNFFVNFYLL